MHCTTLIPAYINILFYNRLVNSLTSHKSKAATDKLSPKKMITDCAIKSLLIHDNKCNFKKREWI